MIHDPDILDQLSKLPVEEYSGEVYRATRKNLNPLAPSSNGGRWMPKGEGTVLYTSLTSDGALAELTFHWGMLSPLPSKPAILSCIDINISSALRILRTDLGSLGVDESKYMDLNYNQMQKIGAAVAFFDCHGLRVPSARWSCDNLVVFTDNLSDMESMELKTGLEVDWQSWAAGNGLLD